MNVIQKDNFKRFAHCHCCSNVLKCLSSDLMQKHNSMEKAVDLTIPGKIEKNENDRSEFLDLKVQDYGL